ncbi:MULTISPECIES: hypothetical protein [unclassified Serratia (in: enterobacteria)]|uniref:hypothetical protein n=1 Tax=unclassified Serratia (in: enterobacteria) TaxID=2647522 RepID=UPI003B4337B3
MRQLSIGMLVASLLGFGMAVAAPMPKASADTSAAIAPVANSTLNGLQKAPEERAVSIKQVQQHQAKQVKHHSKKKHHGKKYHKKKQ